MKQLPRLLFPVELPLLAAPLGHIHAAVPVSDRVKLLTIGGKEGISAGDVDGEAKSSGPDKTQQDNP